jgi:hypothetical protein
MRKYLLLTVDNFGFCMLTASKETEYIQLNRIIHSFFKVSLHDELLKYSKKTLI